MIDLNTFATKAMQLVGRQGADTVGMAEAAQAMSRGADQAIADAGTKSASLAKDSLSLSSEARVAKTSAPAEPHPVDHDLHGNVLVTYLTVGNGHQKSAEAIAEAFHRNYPGVNVKTVDLASVTSVGKLAAKLFYPLVNSGYYPKFYELTNHPMPQSGFSKVGQWLMQKTSPDFTSLMRQFNPDAVISTHGLGAKLVGDGMEKGTIPATVRNFQVVTDEYGHGTYVMPHLDGTFVPSPEVANQLTEKGMDKGHINVSGIPINPVFAELPKGDVRQALGFDKNSRVLLVQGNLVNDPEQYKSLMTELAAKYPNGVNGKPIEVAVATGKNEPLKAQLDELSKSYAGPIKLRPFGMLNATQMRDLMRASDLSVTKPGGLTTAESVATELPMVLLDVMGGGQEAYNAEHFAQVGAGVSTHDFGQATQQVVSLLGNDQQLQAMRDAAVRIRKPNAAETVADMAASSIQGK